MASNSSPIVCATVYTGIILLKSAGECIDDC